MSYKYADLYLKNSVDKQLKIVSDSGITIDNTMLHSENFILEESLCSEDSLVFGTCEASTLKFRVSNVISSLKGKWLTVSETLNGNTDVLFQFGKYKVYSDKPTADRSWRDVEAYDAMYDILNTNVYSWYATLTFPMTLKAFRDSFFTYFGISQESISLINDSMTVEKTIIAEDYKDDSSSVISETLSGKEVINAICEINGCFGHINRSGNFEYIYLKEIIEGLYPSNQLYPSNDIFPRETNTTRLTGTYISCTYEDFITQKITQLQIHQEENDIGVIVGKVGNSYIITGNFLVYGKGTSELTQIANRVLNKISVVRYRPFECSAKGNPCIGLGETVRIQTKRETVYSYVLKRTLTGIQSLKDNYVSSGTEYFDADINSSHFSIVQLKGKANILKRTIEETLSKIVNVEDGLMSQISQTAEKIRTEVQNIKGGLESSITQTADSIRTDVSNTYETKKNADDTKVEIQSSITQTANSIKQEVSENYTTKSDTDSKVSVLSSSITQNAKQIASMVTKDGVVSSINQSAEKVKIKASKLELDGDTQITGGTIHIETTESVDNIIQLQRNGTLVKMGNDGMLATDKTRTAIFQYSQIGIAKNSGSGEIIARLTDNGKGISSYGWDSYSDKRLKHDIELLDIDKSAKFIYSLEPSKFKYNYDPDGHYRHGFIAQKVKASIGADDWAVCGENQFEDGTSYMTVNYLELIADLVATVQSLHKRVCMLEEGDKT